MRRAPFSTTGNEIPAKNAGLDFGRAPLTATIAPQCSHNHRIRCSHRGGLSMGLVWLKRWAAYALIAVLFALAAARPVRADDVSKIDTLNQQVTQLQGQGKYARAVPIAQRALALAEKAFGPE